VPFPSTPQLAIATNHPTPRPYVDVAPRLPQVIHTHILQYLLEPTTIYPHCLTLLAFHAHIANTFSLQTRYSVNAQIPRIPVFNIYAEHNLRTGEPIVPHIPTKPLLLANYASVDTNRTPPHKYSVEHYYEYTVQRFAHNTRHRDRNSLTRQLTLTRHTDNNVTPLWLLPYVRRGRAFLPPPDTPVHDWDNIMTGTGVDNIKRCVRQADQAKAIRNDPRRRPYVRDLSLIRTTRVTPIHLAHSTDPLIYDLRRPSQNHPLRRFFIQGDQPLFTPPQLELFYPEFRQPSLLNLPDLIPPDIDIDELTHDDLQTVYFHPIGYQDNHPIIRPPHMLTALVNYFNHAHATYYTTYYVTNLIDFPATRPLTQQPKPVTADTPYVPYPTKIPHVIDDLPWTTPALPSTTSYPYTDDQSFIDNLTSDLHNFPPYVELTLVDNKWTALPTSTSRCHTYDSTHPQPYPINYTFGIYREPQTSQFPPTCPDFYFVHTFYRKTVPCLPRTQYFDIGQLLPRFTNLPYCDTVPQPAEPHPRLVKIFYHPPPRVTHSDLWYFFCYRLPFTHQAFLIYHWIAEDETPRSLPDTNAARALFLQQFTTHPNHILRPPLVQQTIDTYTTTYPLDQLPEVVLQDIQHRLTNHNLPSNILTHNPWPQADFYRQVSTRWQRQPQRHIPPYFWHQEYFRLRHAYAYTRHHNPHLLQYLYAVHPIPAPQLYAAYDPGKLDQTISDTNHYHTIAYDDFVRMIERTAPLQPTANTPPQPRDELPLIIGIVHRSDPYSPPRTPPNAPIVNYLKFIHSLKQAILLLFTPLAQRYYPRYEFLLQPDLIAIRQLNLDRQNTLHPDQQDAHDQTTANTEPPTLLPLHQPYYTLWKNNAPLPFNPGDLQIIYYTPSPEHQPLSVPPTKEAIQLRLKAATIIADRLSNHYCLDTADPIADLNELNKPAPPPSAPISKRSTTPRPRR